jgi:putative hydrolase of the HAD superfamily
VLIYSHETGISKPDARIYALACAQLDVAPEEAVFVDDTDVRADGARQAGLHAILYQHNAQVIGELDALLVAR